MDYKWHYERLIETRRNKIPNGYYERHHIVMKSMGGTDDPSNIVNLTPREHFIAHLLLFNIYKNSQTAWALLCISNTKFKASARKYDEARRIMANDLSIKNKCRWSKFTKEERSAIVKKYNGKEFITQSEIDRRTHKRVQKIDPKRRKEISRKATATRWDNAKKNNIKYSRSCRKFVFSLFGNRIKILEGKKAATIFCQENNIPYSTLVFKFLPWNGWECKSYSPNEEIK